MSRGALKTRVNALSRSIRATGADIESRGTVLTAAGEILLRQYLAFLDCRLIERIDTEEVGRDDRLQHEVHEQFAEARLVKCLDMNAAHRAAIPGQRLDGGTALRGDEIADG